MPDVLKTVGRYEILRELGRGGMALVYLARQTDLDRYVALKELGAFHASDVSFAQRFIRESRVAGSLSHPNIVTVHDYFEHDGTPYIAMEFVERGSLRPYVGTMTLAQIGGVLEGLLAGLAAGEQHGIVHRDLKPENLMVTSDGRVKIADFGIAKATQASQTGAFLTATGTTVGTPTYMAPEQAMAQEVGSWTDLYSVGCMAYEMFTGKPPFHDSDAPMAILLRHVNEQIPRAADQGVDQEFSDWIERMTTKDPKARTQTAAEAWDEFEEIIIGKLGPRWRREARLQMPGDKPLDIMTPPPPLTPAPFEGAPDGAGDSDEFVSYAGSTAAPPPEAPPAPPPGPATPPPMAAPETGFVTFGAPSAVPVPAETPPPAEAAPPPAEAPPAEAAPPAEPPPAEAPPPEAPPPAEAPAGPTTPPPFEAAPAAEAPTVEEEDTGFETYIAPAPMRPPTADAPPPVEAPPPAPPQPEPVASAPPAPPAPPPPTPAPPPMAPDPGATVMPEALKKPTPPPTPPSPPPKKPAEPKPERSVVPFAIGAAVVAAVIGFVIGGSGGGGETAAGFTKPAANADVEVLTPADWAPAPDVKIPGTETMTEAIAVAPGGKGGGEAVIAGIIPEDASNSSLLSKGMLSAIGGTAPEARDTVQLTRGKVQAYRYEGLSVDGVTGKVTVFAAPTSKGVATVACILPATGAGSCEGVADTLKLNDGTAFPVGPNPEYAKALTGALGTLDKAVKSGRDKLADAKTPAAQGSAAADVADAYGKAASTIEKLELSPADKTANAQLVAALKAADKAYGQLAAAARKSDRSGYSKAQAAVGKAEDSVKGSLDGLAAAGYESK